MMALREGYFVQIGSDEFKWTHDRIHQAAKELASTEMHNNVHFVLAQHMMKGTLLTNLYVSQDYCYSGSHIVNFFSIHV